MKHVACVESECRVSGRYLAQNDLPICQMLCFLPTALMDQSWNAWPVQVLLALVQQLWSGPFHLCLALRNLATKLKPSLC